MIEVPNIADSLTRAPEYTVRVDGQSVPVLDTRVGAAATFAFDGRVEVVIEVLNPPERVDVRPLHAGITAQVEGRTVHLSLDRPGNFSIEFDGNTMRPLFLFAGPLRLERPDPDDPRVITLAAGRVHRFDELRLQSGQTLFFEPGAVLEAPIRATEAENIRIMGRGIIDARYRIDFKTDALLFESCKKVFIQDVHILDSFGWTLHLFDSEDVDLDNIRLTAWRANCDGVDINTSRRVTVRDSFLYSTDDCVAIKVHNPKGLARHPIGVNEVLIERTVFWNGAGGNAMEVGFELNGAVVQGIVFRDCDIIRVDKGACLSIHVGDTATVRDVLFEDIRVEDARDELIDFTIGLSIYSHDCPEPYQRRNGFNVPPELQDMETNDNWLQWIVFPEPDYSRYIGGRGRIEDITIRGLSVFGPEMPPSLLKGYSPEKNVSRVLIENLTVDGRPIHSAEDARMLLRHAETVEFRPLEWRL